MKNKKILSLLLIALSFTLIGCNTYIEGEKGPTGQPGNNGQDGLNGANGINGNDGAILYDGTGKPSTSLGKEYDLYLDTSNGDIYRKENNSRKVITNIYGEDGSNGNNGNAGTNGETAYSSSILPSYGGTIIPSKGSALIDETITFTFIPEENNSLKSITINDEVILKDDARISTNENNVSTYETIMIENGFVVSATFIDQNGNEITPSTPGSEIDFLVSPYTTYNDEFNLTLNNSPFYQFTEDDLTSYYSSIDFNADKTTLMSTLFDLLKTDFKHLNYRASNSKYSSETAYLLTDRDYEKDPLTLEETNSNKWKTSVVIDPLYDESSPTWSSNFTQYNREHIWAKSRGFSDYESSYAGTDMHHLRLADPSENSSRENKFFDDNTTNTTWCPPSKDDRGDLARAIFYMATRYSQYETNSPWLILVENPKETNCETSETQSSPAEFGVLSTLLRWHKEDPVSTFELGRNNFVYNVQGNRNPFIDYPDLAYLLFE